MGRTLRIAMVVALAFGLVGFTTAHAASFYTISGVTSDTAGSDFFAASNLIEGAGVGFDAAAPHNQSGATWVTNAPNGGAGDYFGPTPATGPRLVFDLGADTLLSEISIWGYADGNANGANQVSLQFATATDGTGGFGTSVTYNPTFNPTQPTAPRQSFGFSELVYVRYVELTPEDNFFGINPPGGDRVGLGEVAFEKEVYVVTPVGATSNGAGGGDLYAVGQLIDGSGLSNTSPDISNILSVTHGTTGSTNSWVTNNPNGSGDFYANGTADPVLEFDLGNAHLVSAMVAWNYSVVGNAAKTFDADFIIDGVVVDMVTGLTFASSTNPANLISFGGHFLADTIRITITDNYLEAGAGGDRVGLGEVRFVAIPEPGTLSLLALSAPFALRRKRRSVELCTDE